MIRIVFFLLLLSPGLLLAATIEVTTDRRLLHEGESFELIFTADGSPDEDPDFRPLEQAVEVLQTQTNRSYSYINGQIQNQLRWTVTVMPLQAGTLQIPSISFGKDRSPPLKLSIRAGRQADDSVSENLLQLEIEGDYQQVYVQTPITLTVRLLQTVRVDQADLSKPEISIGEAAVEQSREDRQYQVQREGRSVLVTERTFSISPQSAGPLRIEPFVLKARVFTGGAGGRRIGGLFNRGSGQIVRRQTEAIDIEVLPIPAQFSGRHWLPAIQLDLQEAWSDSGTELKVGEPITRTLKLSATGPGKAQLPQLMNEAPPGWKIYPDQPQLEQSLPERQLVSERTEKIALIPTRSGELSLPELSLHWWNLETDSEEILSLPARSFTVAAAPATVIAPPAQSPVDEQQRLAPVPQELTQTVVPNWVMPALIASGLGWLLAAWLWWQQRQAQNRAIHTLPTTESPPGQRQAERDLQQACQRNDPAAARKALLDWAAAASHDIPIGGLEQVGNLFNGKLDAALEVLGQQLYRHSQNHWDGNTLWQPFIAHKSQIRLKQARVIGPELRPLHRIG